MATNHFDSEWNIVTVCSSAKLVKSPQRSTVRRYTNTHLSPAVKVILTGVRSDVVVYDALCRTRM